MKFLKNIQTSIHSTIYSNYLYFSGLTIFSSKKNLLEMRNFSAEKRILENEENARLEKISHIEENVSSVLTKIGKRLDAIKSPPEEKPSFLVEILNIINSEFCERIEQYRKITKETDIRSEEKLKSWEKKFEILRYDIIKRLFKKQLTIDEEIFNETWSESVETPSDWLVFSETLNSAFQLCNRSACLFYFYLEPNPKTIPEYCELHSEMQKNQDDLLNIQIKVVKIYLHAILSLKETFFSKLVQYKEYLENKKTISERGARELASEENTPARNTETFEVLEEMAIEEILHFRQTMEFHHNTELRAKNQLARMNRPISR